MNIEIEESNNRVILRLKGNIIGGPDSTEFNNSIKQLISQGKIKIVIDLGNVSYVNSTGLSILFRGDRTVKEAGGDMKFASLNEKMKNLLLITKLNTIFDIYDSVEEAVKGFE